MNDHYATLGVRRNASLEEIKKAYLTLVRSYHPDKLPSGTPELVRRDAAEKFLVIKNAYDVLSSSERFLYDSSLGITAEEPRPRAPSTPSTPPSPQVIFCTNCGSPLTEAGCARCIKQQSSAVYRMRRRWAALEEYLDKKPHVVLLWLAFVAVGLPSAIVIPQTGVGDGGPWDSRVCGMGMGVFGFAGFIALIRRGVPGIWRDVKSLCTKQPFMGNFAVLFIVLIFVSLVVGATQPTPKANTPEQSFAAFLRTQASGQFTGTVVNTTVNQSARIELAIQQNGDVLAGCLLVQRPLYGSGQVTGSVRDRTFEFVAHSSFFDIKFTGKNDGDKMSGTYVVVRGGTGEQHGTFTLSRSRTALADGLTSSDCRSD